MNSQSQTSSTRGPWIALALVALALAVPAYLYDQMPDAVPSHWNAHGELDATIAKPLGPFVMAMACAAIAAIYVALPRLSPRGFDLERFRGAYDAIMLSMVGAMAAISVAVAFAGSGVALSVGPVIGVALGVVFAILGNFMGKVQRNFFVGIRTPWTLSSEEVWLRTHRLAGKLFVASGVALALSSLVGALSLGVAVTVGAALASVVYSYVLYRRLEA
ncbi:MAG: SdpI family protein [Deltaproteobacteria bacterium]|jgi:uncharacterized membrane protein